MTLSLVHTGVLPAIVLLGIAVQADAATPAAPRRFVEAPGARSLWAAKSSSEQSANLKLADEAAPGREQETGDPKLVGVEPSSWKLNWRRQRPHLWDGQSAGAVASQSRSQVIRVSGLELSAHRRLGSCKSFRPLDWPPRTPSTTRSTIRRNPEPRPPPNSPKTTSPLEPPRSEDSVGADRPLKPAPPEPADSSPQEAETLPPPIGERRDCQREGEKCNSEHETLQANPITNIDLNVTPLLQRSPTGAELPDKQGAEDKRAKLAEEPSRAWTSRGGETVAVGRLNDYKNGRVYIQKEDGQTAEISVNQLSENDLCYVAELWNLPTECTLADDSHQPRAWVASTLNWKASNLCHKPLYFEEPQLERYGHATRPILQPVASGAHFFLSVAGLPYKMGIHPPNECQYPLGYYRPGNCAPWLLPPMPISLRGGLAQAGAVTGAVFALP